MTKTAVITSIARTPIGKLLGELKLFSAYELGSFVIKAVINRAHLSPTDIDEVIMGCVLPAGQGQAPARQAALKAGLPASVPCTTINKVCGSSMKAIMLGHDMIQAGSVTIMIAGGMESMTNAPYLLLKARQGYRLGHSELYDHMTLDGLEDAYDKGKSMGVFAESCAKEFNFTRQQQDDYALTSFERARKATTENYFANEIVPITYNDKLGEHIVDKDEHPFSVKLERLSALPAAFVKEGTVTAGNSSSIADGAAAVSIMALEAAESRGIKPLATIITHVTVADEPSRFTTAPIAAIKKLLTKLNWRVQDVDLFEINEAFAVVTLAAMKELAIPHDKLNIYGSGCALGHPIGATGARIVVTLISALKQKGLRRGVASLCIGGGEATAIAIEMM